MTRAGEIKSALRKIGAGIYHRSGLVPLRHRGSVAILGYHRVLGQAEVDGASVLPGMYVLTEVFEKHIQFLQEHFEIISLAEALARWRAGDHGGRARYCVLTFDDGWLDNYQNALPVLRRYGVPATIFLATAFVGTSSWFWWDEVAHVIRHSFLARGRAGARLLADLPGRHPWFSHLAEAPAADRLDPILEQFKGLPHQDICEWIDAGRRALGLDAPSKRVLLNWSEVEEMSASDISFGSHSCTHRILTRLSNDEVRRELSDSRDALNQRRIRSIPVFCYPNGDYNEQVATEARRAGYEAAVSGRSGLNSGVVDDLWALRRIAVHNDVAATPALLALRMSGLPWT